MRKNAGPNATNVVSAKTRDENEGEGIVSQAASVSDPVAKCADFLRYLWRFPARRKSCPRGRRSGFPSLTDVTSGFFYSMGAAAARESRGRIIKNPRSPRGKNDRVVLFISFEWVPSANYSSLAR